MSGYIYVIQVREFLKANESVVKVGQTEDILRRFYDYPKGSRLIYTCFVSDCKLSEKIMLQKMKDQFIVRRDLGREYFEGNIASMIGFIQTITTLPTNYFECVSNKDSNACDCMEIDQPILLKDVDVIIKHFIEQNIKTYDGIVTKSSLLHEAFNLWLENNRDIVSYRYISHKRFSSGLKELFGAIIKPQRFQDGVAVGVLIYGPESVRKTEIESSKYQVKKQVVQLVVTLDEVKTWMDEKYEITPNRSDRIKSIDIYNLFMEETKYQNTSVKFFYHLVKSIGILQFKSNGVTVFIGLRKKTSHYI